MLQYIIVLFGIALPYYSISQRWEVPSQIVLHSLQVSTYHWSSVKLGAWAPQGNWDVVLWFQLQILPCNVNTHCSAKSPAEQILSVFCLLI